MIEGITRPTLLLDMEKVEANIDLMLAKATATNTKLIPHFKTHQSKEVGELFRSRGINAITVSSVAMAEYFVANGWKDITIAFPFNRLEVSVINSFVSKGVQVKLFVTDLDTIEFLDKNLLAPIDVFIEVDAGYGRSGVESDSLSLIKCMAESIVDSDKMNFYGLYCHSGNTYHANSVTEIKEIWVWAIDQMSRIKLELKSLSDSVKIRMGDTPGCCVVTEMDGVDEIGPGNFVFFDLVMNYLNVCEENQIAVALACPIVAKYPERNELVIHGGAVHFSKDHLFDNAEQKFFGELVILEPKGWSSIVPEAKLTSLSQEHGIITVNDDLLETLQVGDVIGVLPIHSCLTANLMRGYLTTDGTHMEHI